MRRVKTQAQAALLVLAVGACTSILPACQRGSNQLDTRADTGVVAPVPTDALPRETLLDPVACQACHPAHYEEWSGSMHAYASRDPVFVAMNARGQEETGGALGDFCVQCHAPMALREGLTKDGLNLASLPDAYQGVTCYFCHAVDAVEGTHNNPLRLSNDQVMRGPFRDPNPTSAHASSYSTHFDKDHADSAALCGACHDVAVHDAFAPADVSVERTFLEWQDTLFNAPAHEGGLTCNGCHMPISPSRDRSAVGDDQPQRRSRRHDFEGVDVAIDDFPGKTRQRLLVQQFLDSSLLGEICVSRDGVVAVTLENAGAGHHWPSGASHDRIAWLDVRAYDQNSLVYRTTEPELTAKAYLNNPADAMADGGSGEEPDATLGSILSLTDDVVDEAGNEAHFFWEVFRVNGSTTLPGVVTRDPQHPEFHRERRTWEMDTEQTAFDSIERVELTVKLRPIKLAVLAELVRSGHLERTLALNMPTFELIPARCHSRSEVEQYPDILVGARTDCDPKAPEHAHTLVWTRADATADNRNFRQTVIRAAPARCLAHPTYIPPP